MTEEEKRRRQAFNSGPAAGTLRIVGDPASNPGMPSGTGGMTVYQQALAAHPQQNTLYSPDRRGDLDANFRISDDTKGAWGQIAQLYQAGDAAGAQALISSMAGKDGMTGFYNDDGTYTGMVRGYKADANGSYQPVISGRPMWTGDPETNIWLKPDGTTFTFEGGVLQNSDTRWSRNREPAPYRPRTWTDVQSENGLSWGDTYAIKAAHGDFTNPALNTPEGNARKREVLYEKPLGFTDEEWAKHTGNYYPDYAAEIAAAAGTSGRGHQPGSSAPGENTLWQTYLAKYDSGEAPRWTGGAYDPETDTLWQQYLAQFDGAEAPKWQGSDHASRRDAAVEQAAAPFVYELEKDPVWQAYRKQYLREGARAGEDTLGRYAAMTGGVPSTAAVSAAQQASGNYAARLTDKIPELYQQAYQRYLQEYQRQLGLAGAYDDYDRESYDRYRDELDQWNRDRSFAYDAARDNQQLGRQQVEDQYGRYRDAVGDARYEDERNYSRWRDSIEDQRYDQERAQKLREYADEQNWKATEWEQYLREYGDQLSEADRKWAYQQLRDAVSDARYEDTTAYNRAIDAWQRQQEEAQLAAKYGDYSGLQGMGIDTGKADPKEVAYAPDGSTYKFNSDDALYFTQNAPNGTPGNPTVLRGGDGSIWRKDEYGGVTIEKNGKIYTYSAGQVPAQASTGSGSRSSGGSSIPKTASDYIAQMREADIKTLKAAKGWLAMNASNLSDKEQSSIADYFMETLGVESNEYTDEDLDRAWKYSDSSDPAKKAWAQKVLSETYGMDFGGGDQGANPGDQSAGYRNLDESLGRMVSRGASRDELYAEIDAEVKDGRITKEQGEALKEKYYGQADNIANSGTHANGMPRSGRYTGTLMGVRQTLDTKGKDAALQALKRALEAGYIHDYEIDYIMDELGLD